MHLSISISIFLFVVLFSQIHALFFVPLKHNRLEPKANHSAGDPLFLTPYLKKGEIKEAQKLSRVPLTDGMGITSYSGFFTVNEIYNSNLFFWYFPPISGNPKAPVLLWLQGGPGATSLFGLFAENGPLVVTKSGFVKRKYHWALDHHLIYIDNPVGTGFSFTKDVVYKMKNEGNVNDFFRRDENGYCVNETCIAQNLHNALQQFFTLFPDLRANEFFISGESYAGKYIPALGMEIHNQNSKGNEEHINLKGMAIGNGYSDPINQLDYGNYLYQYGLLDDNQMKVFIEKQNDIVFSIRQQNYLHAGALIAKLILDSNQGFTYFTNFTGFLSHYHILKTRDDESMSLIPELLNKETVRRAIHVGGLPFNNGSVVSLHLLNDIMQSVAPYVSELLSHYRMLFYNGQLDIIVAYPLTENFLRHLDFDSSEEYKTAERKFWMVDGELAGYVKRAGNLTEVLVRNSGHMVPQDQPKWALDLITRFIRNTLKGEEN